jgi:hypothetical protein
VAGSPNVIHATFLDLQPFFTGEPLTDADVFQFWNLLRAATGGIVDMLVVIITLRGGRPEYFWRWETECIPLDAGITIIISNFGICGKNYLQYPGHWSTEFDHNTLAKAVDGSKCS